MCCSALTFSVLCVIMDEETKKVLKAAKLEDEIESFAEAGISFCELKLLSTELAKELLPRLGHRIRLFDALQKHCRNDDKVIDELMDASASFINEITGDEDQVIPCTSEVKSVAGSPLEKPHVLTERTSPIVCTTPIAPVTQMEKLKQLSDRTAEEMPAAKKPKNSAPSEFNSVLCSPRKGENWHDVAKLRAVTIERLKLHISGILDSNLDGTAVKRAAELDKFSAIQRKILVNLVVTHQMSQNPEKKISPEQFKNLALGIAYYFKNESALTYYIPQVRTGKGQKINPQGKLYERYIKKKDIYRKSGLLNEATRGSPLTLDAVEAVTAEPEVSEEIRKDLLWLGTSFEPYHILESKWKSTSAFRLAELQESNDPIHEYYERYPALKCNFGHKLIDIDFTTLYGTKKGLLYEKWPLLSKNIIKYAKVKVASDSNLKKLILSELPGFPLVDSLSIEEKSFYAVSLLPFLINPGQKGKQHFTKQEAKDTFLLHILNEAELNVALEKRNNLYKEKCLRIQPLAIVIGAEPQCVSCEVEIDNYRYSVDSPLQAIDLCFKALMALNASYAPPSAKIWLFIQKIFFEISTKFDDLKSISAIETLAVELLKN